MRLPALAALSLCLAGGVRAAAGPPQFDATPDRAGFLQLSEGSRKGRVDLRKDVPGCLGQLFDPATGERSQSDASLTVLDTVDRDGRHYVLLSASAPPNCNVQGMCGAADPNVSLIWLKLASDLTVESKQTVVLVDCRTDRSVEGVPNDWEASDLKLADGKLRVAFRDGGNAASGRVEYDRRSPDQGLRVTPPR